MSGTSYYRSLTDKFEHGFDEIAERAGIDTRGWTLMGPDPGGNGPWHIVDANNEEVFHLGATNKTAFLTLRAFVIGLRMAHDPSYRPKLQQRGI